MEEEAKPKPRKKPLAFARFMFGTYAQCLFSRELAADLMQDLVHSGLTNQPAKHEINQEMIDEGYMFILETKRRRQEYSKKQREKDRGGQPQEDPNLFSQKKESEVPTPGELKAYAEQTGASVALAEDFFTWSTSNDWKDKGGKPIRSWQRAFMAFVKTKNPDFKPTTTALHQGTEEHNV
jgi:hypothetical protein